MLGLHYQLALTRFAPYWRGLYPSKWWLFGLSHPPLRNPSSQKALSVRHNASSQCLWWHHKGHTKIYLSQHTRTCWVLFFSFCPGSLPSHPSHFASLPKSPEFLSFLVFFSFPAFEGTERTYFSSHWRRPQWDGQRKNKQTTQNASRWTSQFQCHNQIFALPQLLRVLSSHWWKTAEGFLKNICQVLSRHTHQPKSRIIHFYCVLRCVWVYVHAYVCERVCRSRLLVLSLTIRSVWSARQT